MTRRLCAHLLSNGQHCGSPPLRDGPFCLWHSPEHAKEVQESRKLGGMRRKREVLTSGAYEFQGLESVADIRRLLQIAVLDTLALENSISRNRTLAYLVMAALKALESGDMEARIAALEQAVQVQRQQYIPPAFDVEATAVDIGEGNE